MPAAKKDPSVRARVNKASTAAKLSGSVERNLRPKLPPGEWNDLTVEWWDDLWAAPMAAEYHSSDRHALMILAALVNAFWEDPSKELAGEIRLQRTAFGLTPYDRRRLEWTIETADEAKDRGRQRRGRSSPRTVSANDPRSALRAVN